MILVRVDPACRGCEQALSDIFDFAPSISPEEIEKHLREMIQPPPHPGPRVKPKYDRSPDCPDEWE